MPWRHFTLLYALLFSCHVLERRESAHLPAPQCVKPHWCVSHVSLLNWGQPLFHGDVVVEASLGDVGDGQQVMEVLEVVGPQCPACGRILWWHGAHLLWLQQQLQEGRQDAPRAPSALTAFLLQHSVFTAMLLLPEIKSYNMPSRLMNLICTACSLEMVPSVLWSSPHERTVLCQLLSLAAQALLWIPHCNYIPQTSFPVLMQPALPLSPLIRLFASLARTLSSIFWCHILCLLVCLSNFKINYLAFAGLSSACFWRTTLSNTVRLAVGQPNLRRHAYLYYHTPISSLTFRYLHVPRVGVVTSCEQ